MDVPRHAGEDPVLVTGAGGLLGSAVVTALGQAGVPVLAAGRERYADREAPDVVVDLGSPQDAALLRSLPDLAAVVHCAAALPTSHTSAGAQQAADRNARIDESVIGLCRERSLHLVYCSGASVYGPTGDRPADEQARLAPFGPYAAGKLAAERSVADLLDSFCVLRPTALYGPRQRSATVLRTFVDRALAEEDLCYHGSGTREQDFVHAEDVAGLCVTAVQRRGTRLVLNAASGRTVTMGELAQRVAQRALLRGRTARVRSSGQPDPQEGARARYDAGLAGRELGWYAVTDLDEGIDQLLTTRARWRVG